MTISIFKSLKDYRQELGTTARYPTQKEGVEKAQSALENGAYAVRMFWNPRFSEDWTTPENEEAE